MTNHLLAHDHTELDAAQSAVFAALSAGNVEQSFHCLDFFWGRLAVHIRAENVHLFPTLQSASDRLELSPDAPTSEAVKTIIVRLRDDHDSFMHELNAAMKELRDFQHGDTCDASTVLANVRQRMTEVCERLESHNALEETQVYHWAAMLLNGPEQKSLGEAIRHDLENLPPRLKEK